jgi:hypothetical protein
LFQDLDNGQDLKAQPASNDDYDSLGGTAQDLPLDSEDVTLAVLGNSEDVTLAELGNSSTKQGKPTYQFVAEKATVL